MSMPSKSKSKVYIVTSLQYPQGNADLRDLCNTLRREGVECDFLLWGEKRACYGDLLLPLAAWDYSLQPERFLSWLKELQTLGVKILNPLATIEKNINKSYLLALQEKGIPIVPSEFVKYEELRERDLRGKVIKPMIGQSGMGVERGEYADICKYPQGAIIQPFIPGIQKSGEVCLIFFDGEFKYSILRKPKEWKANSNFGVQISRIQAKREWIDLAYQALDGIEYFYARVDLFIEPLLVNEVELIEPALYFSYNQRALRDFVSCLLLRNEVEN